MAATRSIRAIDVESPAQRQTIDFDTGSRAYPYLGERVAVSHTLPNWGLSGFVAAVNGLEITLDRELPSADTPAPRFMMFRTETGGATAPVEVTPGATPNKAILSEMPLMRTGEGWHVGERQENTHFVFGNETRMVRDFIMAEIRSKGGMRVTLGGMIYQPHIFAGTLSFLAGPVP